MQLINGEGVGLLVAHHGDILYSIRVLSGVPQCCASGKQKYTKHSIIIIHMKWRGTELLHKSPKSKQDIGHDTGACLVQQLSAGGVSRI